jgi:hypothetical protein
LKTTEKLPFFCKFTIVTKLIELLITLWYFVINNKNNEKTKEPPTIYRFNYRRNNQTITKEEATRRYIILC